MRTRVIIALGFFMLLFIGCKQRDKKETQEVNGHKIEVKEVKQVISYTYILAEENGEEYWIAVPKMVVEPGNVLYFSDMMEMNNFESKDLGVTFETIYFVQSISDKPQVSAQSIMGEHHGNRQAGEKLKEIIEPVAGGISLAELFNNKKKYANKKVMVTGKLVKANLDIMHKNWYHIQDGTESNGFFDLTITSQEQDLEIGKVYTFEGIIVLDKDFGHGYTYDLLLEEGALK